MNRSIKIRALGCCVFVVLCSGCSNLTLRKAQSAYMNNDLVSAQALIDEYSQKEGEGVNRVIAHLEKGNIYRTIGQYELSNQAFQIADEAIEIIDQQPEVKLSQEALAALTNLNALTYRGYGYDRIMMNTYRAMNYLTVGESGKARVELRRAYQQQQDAVAKNAKRIEEAKEAAEYASKSKSTEGFDYAKTRNSSGVQNKLNEEFGYLNKFRAYSDYVNPYCELFQGIYYMSSGVDEGDKERARLALKRAASMAPRNEYLKHDLSLAEKVAAGGNVQPMTYVIFETGVAPSRGQIRIDLPLFVVSNKVDYVGVNFPRLIKNDKFLSSLRIDTGNDTHLTELVADMDSVVAREFKNELPIIITKTLIAAGTKAAIAYAAREAAKKQSSDVELATRLITTIYQAVVNEADLRTWVTLPKQFQYASFPTPESRNIKILAGNQATIPVALIPGQVNVVVVRSINPTAPVRISQFKLR